MVNGEHSKTEVVSSNQQLSPTENLLQRVKAARDRGDISNSLCTDITNALETYSPVETDGDQGLYCEQESAHDPADGPMSAAVCLGCWNKLAQEVIELRKQVGAATICGHPECDNDSVLGECSRSPLEPTRELTLRDFGYAPGNYTFKCLDCGQESVGDKRAGRCETCAAQAMRENRSGVKATAPLDREAVNALALQCAQASAVVRQREWNFDRYRNGQLMAQGVKVHAATETEAWIKAKELLHIDGNKPTDELRLQPLKNSDKCPKCGFVACDCPTRG